MANSCVAVPSVCACNARVLHCVAMSCRASDLTRVPKVIALLTHRPVPCACPPLPGCARSTYDQKWQEAMAELNEQVHIEDDTLDLEEGDEPPPVRGGCCGHSAEHCAACA